MEPTPQDVAAVAATLPNQPAQQPAQQPPATPPTQTTPPAQPQTPTQQPQTPPAPTEPAAPQTPTQQPTTPPTTPTEPGTQQPAVTPQPAPSQQPEDPFATLFASEPQTPTPPAQPQTPPAEGQQPQGQPPTQPEAAPAQAPAQPPAQPQEDYQTFKEYIDQALSGVGKPPDIPDAGKIDPNDPKAIKGFFDNLVNVAVERATNEVKQGQAIQESERKLWDSAFDKYGSLRTNQKARDLVHNIRMGYFQKGKAITPKQAADILLDSMGQQYRKGVADNQVHTTIEQVQPTAGGGAPVPTTSDEKQLLTDLQSGGETVLAEYLDSEVKAGRL